jgi:hypothetical protein
VIILLDVFLFIAFVSTIAVDTLTRQPTGPEGPIGVWLLLVMPCLFAAILVFTLAAQGLLNFVPGGRLARFAIATGVLATFSIAIFGTLNRHNGGIPAWSMVVPYLLLAGCGLIIHHSHLPDSRLGHWVAVLLLGGTALAGWGVLLYVQADLQQSARRAQKEREQEDQNKQWEAIEYAKLDDAASLYSFLRFIWSRNEQVRRQAQEKVSRFPGLADKLIALIDQDCDEAISYVAKLYENPPIKLAPSWGRMLERQLKKWDTLQYDAHAGTWEPNLKVYFIGAQKIQRAGGSLHTELRLWHKHLQKCKGLGNLAAFVNALL